MSAAYDDLLIDDLAIVGAEADCTRPDVHECQDAIWWVGGRKKLNPAIIRAILDRLAELGRLREAPAVEDAEPADDPDCGGRHCGRGRHCGHLLGDGLYRCCTCGLAVTS